MARGRVTSCEAVSTSVLSLNEALQDVGTLWKSRAPATQSAQILEVVSRHLAAFPVSDELETHLLTFAQIA
jgi:hypothetical protein